MYCILPLFDIHQLTHRIASFPPPSPSPPLLTDVSRLPKPLLPTLQLLTLSFQDSSLPSRVSPTTMQSHPTSSKLRPSFDPLLSTPLSPDSLSLPCLNRLRFCRLKLLTRERTLRRITLVPHLRSLKGVEIRTT